MKKVSRPKNSLGLAATSHLFETIFERPKHPRKGAGRTDFSASGLGPLHTDLLEILKGDGETGEHYQKRGHADQHIPKQKEGEQEENSNNEQSYAATEVTAKASVKSPCCHASGELRILLVELPLDFFENFLLVVRKRHSA
jgi:hypothetical protein